MEAPTLFRFVMLMACGKCNPDGIYRDAYPSFRPCDLNLSSSNEQRCRAWHVVTTYQVWLKYLQPFFL